MISGRLIPRRAFRIIVGRKVRHISNLVSHTLRNDISFYVFLLGIEKTHKKLAAMDDPDCLIHRHLTSL